MTFINFPNPTPVFPVLAPQAWSTHKEPQYNTNTLVAVSGREYQLARNVYPRWNFTLTFGGDTWLRDQTQNQTPYGPLTGHTELEQLAGLFLMCLGSYGEFYYSDPDDNSRTLGFTASGVNSYPLFFTWGNGPFTPALYFPVSGINTISAVYVNSVLRVGNYSVDATNTAITFTTPIPNNGDTIVIYFSFYFRCHFLNDVEEFDQWAKNLWENKTLKFQSVKP